MLAVNARLCVGKEGPLAHIGANLGAMVLYIPGLGFEFLRNDEKKRQFVAAGASVGVSAAFGAPIGGTLFCFELSRPNTFWRFEMLYKVFFACCTGTFSLSLAKHLFKHADQNKMNASDIKFGYNHKGTVQHLLISPHVLVLAFVGGITGALFIIINTKVNALRKRFLTSKWILPLETMIIAFLTGLVMFWYPYFDHNCEIINQHLKAGLNTTEPYDVEFDTMYSAFCEQKYYSKAGQHLMPNEQYN